MAENKDILNAEENMQYLKDEYGIDIDAIEKELDTQLKKPPEDGCPGREAWWRKKDFDLIHLKWRYHKVYDALNNLGKKYEENGFKYEINKNFQYGSISIWVYRIDK